MKMLLIGMFFLGYAIMQYVLCGNFFEKAQMSLTALLDYNNRDPYLTSTLTFFRESVLMGTPQLDSQGRPWTFNEIPRVGVGRDVLQQDDDQ